MRIGVLTFYYPPDLSAGSFRAAALIAALRELAPPGTQIDVITTMPNRYHSVPASARQRDRVAGLDGAAHPVAHASQ